MTNEAFQALLARGPVLLDGATGSNLMRAGMPRGICTEVWVTEHPEPLLALQRDYIAAGSQIIYAPTFCANRRGLARCGRENDVALLNRQLVALSREAAGGRVLGVTALGGTLADAIHKAYAAAEQIHFDGAHMRRDIGKLDM